MSSAASSAAPSIPNPSGEGKAVLATPDNKSPAVAASPPCAYNMTGTFVLDLTKSDDIEPFLAVQGVPWLVRKLAKGSGATQKIVHDDKQVSVTIESTMFTNTQLTVLGLDYKEYKHPRGGMMKQKSWISPDGSFCQSQIRLEAPLVRTEYRTEMQEMGKETILTYHMECFDAANKTLLKLKQMVFSYPLDKIKLLQITWDLLFFFGNVVFTPLTLVFLTLVILLHLPR